MNDGPEKPRLRKPGTAARRERARPLEGAGPQAARSDLRAVAAAPAKGPRTVLRTRIEPSPEMLEMMKVPGVKWRVLLPGDPDSPGPDATYGGPAVSMRSWREDNYACPHCSQAFHVAYGNPPDQASDTTALAVQCPGCGGAVLVAVPGDLTAQEIEVRPGSTFPRP